MGRRRVLPYTPALSRRALVLFGLMSVIWGIPYLFIAIAVDEISPVVLVPGRTAIAAAILLPVALARTDLRPVLARWRWVVVFATIALRTGGADRFGRLGACGRPRSSTSRPRPRSSAPTPPRAT